MKQLKCPACKQGCLVVYIDPLTFRCNHCDTEMSFKGLTAVVSASESKTGKVTSQTRILEG